MDEGVDVFDHIVQQVPISASVSASHGVSVVGKSSNLKRKRVQQQESSAAGKQCSRKAVRQESSAAGKQCGRKAVQHESSSAGKQRSRNVVAKV